MITEDLLPSLQGVIPSTIVTVNNEGIPNTTVISQVYPVGEDCLAISNQFFSKTFQNLHVNPFACVQVINPETGVATLIDMKLDRIEKEGELFEAMEMQLEAIASMSGMQDVFKLSNAYVFKITKITDLSFAINQ